MMTSARVRARVGILLHLKNTDKLPYATHLTIGKVSGRGPASWTCVFHTYICTLIAEQLISDTNKQPSQAATYRVQLPYRPEQSKMSCTIMYPRRTVSYIRRTERQTMQGHVIPQVVRRWEIENPSRPWFCCAGSGRGRRQYLAPF